MSCGFSEILKNSSWDTEGIRLTEQQNHCPAANVGVNTLTLHHDPLSRCGFFPPVSPLQFLTLIRWLAGGRTPQCLWN